MEEVLGNEILEQHVTGRRVDVPQAACLRECQSQARHFTVLTADTSEKKIVRGHDGNFSIFTTVLTVIDVAIERGTAAAALTLYFI